MIVKRNRDERPPARAIVRRSRQTVGQRRTGTIVRRPRGVIGQAQPRVRKLPRPALSMQRLTWAFGVVSAFVVLGYGAWWLYQSPALRVNEVKVTGNERVSTNDIVRGTGLLGDSMFTVDLADAQEVLYDSPLIASVEVRRDWPDAIHIHVQERQPWGTWEQAGTRYTIDRDGVVLGTGGAPEGSPHIRAAETTALQVGQRVSYQAVDAAAEIYEKLPRQLGTTATEIAYVPGTGVQVTTANGQSALLGDSSSIAYKLAVWAALATEARQSGIVYTTIDLRYGNRPVLY